MNKKIILGTATRWDPIKNRLIVRISENEIGFVPGSELTTYDGFGVDQYSYSRAAAYCIDIQLPYMVTSTSIEGPILSRRLLAEDTITTIKSEKFHDYVIGTITGFAENGVYVDVNGAYGLCLSSELSYCFLSTPSLSFNRGEKYQFAITKITEDNKLCLSRISTLPSKEVLLQEYVPNTIISGVLLAPVNRKLDNEEMQSWFFIADNTVPGMVDIPIKRKVRPGDSASIAITRHTDKGLRGNLAC